MRRLFRLAGYGLSIVALAVIVLAGATARTADPALWPPKWETTWFKGTGRSIANEIYFNTAQKPLIESPNGIFSMDEEGIQKNIDALGQIGIKATREMFDTTLLAEI